MANEVKWKIVLEGLKDAENGLKKLSKMTKDTVKDTEGLSRTFGGLDKQLGDTSKESTRAIDGFEGLSDALKGAVSTATDGADSLDDLAAKASQAGNEGESAGKGFDSLRGAMGSVQQTAGSAAAALSDISSKAGMAKGDMSALGGELAETGGDAKRMGGDASSAGGDLVGLGADASNTKGDLGAMGNEAKESGGKFDALKGAADGLAEKLQGIANLAKAAATAVGGVVSGAVVNTMSIDGALMKINSGLGATGEEAAKNKHTFENLFRDGMGGAEDIADAILATKGAMRDLGGEELEGVIKAGFAMEKIYGTDMQETMRALHIVTTQFGIGAAEGMDVLAFGMQQGLNFSGDYLDTLSEYSVQYKNAGYSAQEFTSQLVAGMEGGIHTTDLMADSLGEARKLIISASDETIGALEAMSIVELTPKDMDKMAEKLDKQRESVASLEKQLQVARENRAAGAMDESASFDEYVRKQEAGYNKQVDAVNKLSKQLAEAREAQAELDDDASDKDRKKAAERIEEIAGNLNKAQSEAEAMRQETDKLVAGGVGGFKKMSSTMSQLNDMRSADSIAELEKKLKDAQEEMNGMEGAAHLMETATNGATLTYEELVSGLSGGGEQGKQALEQIALGLETMEDATLRNEYALAIFGTKWEDAGATILDQIAAGKEAMDGFSGSAEEMADKYENSLSVKMAKAFSEFRMTLFNALGPSIEEMMKDFPELMKSLAEAVGPLIEALAEKAKELIPHIIVLVEKFTEWLQGLEPGDIEKFIDGFAKFAVIGTVVAAIASIIIKIIEFVAAIKMAALWISDLYAKGGMFATIVTTIKGAISAVVAFIVANPIAVAIAAALAVIIFLVVKNWDAIKEFLAKWWEGTKEAFKMAFEFLSGLFTWWIETTKQNFQKALEIFKAVGMKIGEFFSNWIKQIGENWEKLWGFLGEAKDKVGEMFSGAVSAVFQYFKDAFQNLKDFVGGIWEFIGGVIDKIFDTIKVPHFKIEGSWDIDPFDGDGVSMPKVAIDWYEKGGIFTGPQVIGVGENGDEAVIPLNNKARVAPFAQAVAALMPAGQQGQGGDGGDTIITGNTFHIREEADILKMAKELHRLGKREKKMR